MYSRARRVLFVKFSYYYYYYYFLLSLSLTHSHTFSTGTSPFSLGSLSLSPSLPPPILFLSLFPSLPPPPLSLSFYSSLAHCSAFPLYCSILLSSTHHVTSRPVASHSLIHLFFSLSHSRSPFLHINNSNNNIKPVFHPTTTIKETIPWTFRRHRRQTTTTTTVKALHQTRPPTTTTITTMRTITTMKMRWICLAILTNCLSGRFCSWLPCCLNISGRFTTVHVDSIIIPPPCAS